MIIDIEKFVQEAEQVFFKPTFGDSPNRPAYSWDPIVTGVRVHQPLYDKTSKKLAVDANTWRAFERLPDLKDSDEPGASVPYRGLFIDSNWKRRIIDGMRGAKEAEDIDKLSDQICDELRTVQGKYSLPAFVTPKSLKSYNRVRKPIDLYLSRLVAMSDEFDNTQRQQIVPHLFMPLDSQAFGGFHLFTWKGDWLPKPYHRTYPFTLDELKDYNLDCRSGFGDVKTRDDYKEIQKKLQLAAKNLRKFATSFHPIYFDMFWNTRCLNPGGNLFEREPCCA